MVKDSLELENVNLGRGSYRNFSGEKGPYNAEGKRSFVVILDEAKAAELEEEGWHIRWRDPRDDMDDRVGLLTVEVRFGAYPPKIMLISADGRTFLDESNVGVLDSAEIERADIRIRPYNWEVRGESGTKAYLQAGYFTLREDDFGGRYR